MGGAPYIRLRQGGWANIQYQYVILRTQSGGTVQDIVG